MTSDWGYTTVADMKQVYEFATKWCDKFRDQDINYIELAIKTTRSSHVETCVLLSHKNPQTSPPSL